MLALTLSGSKAVEYGLSVLMPVFIVIFGLSAFQFFSIYKDKRRLYIFSNLSIVVFVLGMVYFLFFMNFDWRIGTTNTGVIWEKTVGKSGDELAVCLAETSDGDLILAGNTWSYGNRSDVLLVKLDSSGDIMWERVIGGDDSDKVNQFQIHPDNSLILIGTTRSYGNSGDDAWLIKVDSNGEIIWEKTFGGSHNDDGMDVKILPDGGYIVAGKMWTDGNEILEAWVMKTDDKGNEIWSKNLYSPLGTWSKAISIQPLLDGHYLVAGEVWSPEPDNPLEYSRVWFRELNSHGEEVWYRQLDSDTYGDHVLSINSAGDGGNVIAIDSAQNRKDALWLIKLNSSGEEEWSKIYPGNHSGGFNNLILTHGGTFLAISSYYRETFEYDIRILEIDSSGEKIWDKSFDKRRDDKGAVILDATDGYYVLAGDIANDSGGYPYNQRNIWVVKFTK